MPGRPRRHPGQGDGRAAGAPDQAITVTADATVTVTLVDPRQRGAILVTKLRKHVADGPGDHPQPGVDFMVNGVTKTTDAAGRACLRPAVRRLRCARGHARGIQG